MGGARKEDTAAGRIARSGMVEEIASNMTRKPAGVVGDLCSMVYEALLRYDDALLARMEEDGSIRFFVARIISNNIRKKGRFFRIFVDYGRRAVEMAPGSEYGKEEPPY